MNGIPRILTTALTLACHALSAAEFHVAPNGDNANPGTKAKPFATLERARDATREVRLATPDAAIRIVVYGGTYRVGRTIVFDLRDSVAGNARTEIVAAPGERPMFGGAFPLPGAWQRAPHDLARLPEKARGRVWVADVPKEWPVFRTLFEGDQLLPRARTRG